MPLYEYRCENCSEQFEVMQKFSDQPLSTHEKCGGKVVRLLSAPALQFKGTGWYVTDYAKGSSSRGGRNEGGKNEGGKNEGGKSDGGKNEGGSGGDSSNKSETSKKDGSSSSNKSQPSTSSTPSDKK